MVLDAVMADRNVSWLGTEHDKLPLLRPAIGVPRHHLPSVTFRSADEETIRYFPEKLPIGVGRDGLIHVFLYLRHLQRADGFSPVPRASRRAFAQPAGVDHPVAPPASPGRRR